MSVLRHRDVDLHYDRSGSGPPLVLVHCILGSGDYWEPHRPAFDQRWETIAYDCRGHGRSTKPDVPYTMDDHVGDLEALIEGLELDRPALLGYSLGAYIVTGLIVRRPELASRAILASGKVAGRRASSAAHIGLDGIRHGGDAMDQVSHLVFAGEPDPVHTAFLRLMARGMSAREVELAIGSAGGFDVREQLPAADLPVLVLHGADDVLNPVLAAEELARGLPDARLQVFADCGHELPFEQPAQFRHAVEAFLG
ncbi:MAG TPA: alpha/beta fold hydrolase [Capillimicrobium sp.]|nr:alpha/beta fold hydrolase [Capillimicrobium sp.]